MTRNVARSFLSAALSTFLCFGAQMSVSSLAQAQSSSDSGDLVARHQVRLDTVDSELRDLRGILETDLRSLRIQLNALTETAETADLSAVKLQRELVQEIARLDDTVEIMEQRLRRTFELSSDVEFRVLRLERRMETLIALNFGDDNASAIGSAGAAFDSSIFQNRTAQTDTIAGGTAPSVSISRDEETGETVWTVDESQLNSTLTSANAVDADGEAVAGPDSNGISLDTEADAENADVAGDAATAGGTNSDTSILPDAEPEEQFKFALSRALQGDLQVAEQAFEDFRQVNPEHERVVDALFWLGRVQLMQGQYEQSAMTFTTFNSEYPNDVRIVDTTLFIAESVSQFAEAEQACAIYASLPQLLDAPTENFTKRIGELSDSAGC